MLKVSCVWRCSNSCFIADLGWWLYGTARQFVLSSCQRAISVCVWFKRFICCLLLALLSILRCPVGWEFLLFDRILKVDSAFWDISFPNAVVSLGWSCCVPGVLIGCTCGCILLPGCGDGISVVVVVWFL